jgi:hypothetical protein
MNDLPKVVRRRLLFCFLCEIKLSLQSRAPFADLMIQKWSEPDIFCDFYVNSSSRYSIVHFLSTSSSKSAPRALAFWTFWSLATVLCAFCWQLSEIEARDCGNRDLTSATPGATLPEKTQGFAPESVFTREFTRFPTLPNYFIVGGWRDDVVDVMAEILTMTTVRKFSN